MEDAVDINVLFCDLNDLLKLPGFSEYLFREEDFFKITLSILASKEIHNARIALTCFHKVVFLLLKALLKLLQTSKKP